MEALQTIWKGLTEPRASDPDEARREYLTRVVVAMMVPALAIVTGVVTVGWAVDYFTTYSVVTMVLLDLPVLAAAWLTHRGHWSRASFLLPPVFLAHAVYATYFVGFGTWPLTFFLLSVMLTGMLHGIRLQWYMVALAVVSYGGTAWLHGDRIADWIAVNLTMTVALLSGVTLLQWLFTSQWEKANQQLRREIEERRRVEETLRRTQNQLLQSQKLEAIGRLAGGVAHDFNNLLTVVELSTRLIGQHLHRRDPLWDHLHQIEEASERGIRLTRQLLSFSRQEMVESQAIDLSQMVAELSRMLQRIIGEDVELVTELAEGLWCVEADPTQMEQVIVNLAVNARDAMPQGGRLTIQTGNRAAADMPATLPAEAARKENVLLRVRDTGVGMNDEVKAHVFEPFFTTKSEEHGTGLGLPTVYGIVRQNGGHIELESQVRQGTTFSIYLPRSAAPPPVVADLPAAGVIAVDSPAARPAASGGPAATETILIVEDEAAVMHLARQILEEQGYRVLSAGAGPQALRLSQAYEEHIDLLLTDVIMPQMTGRKLAEQLQALRPGLKVLYMSGYSDDALAHHEFTEPDPGFLAKPFSMDGLIQKVRAVLDAGG
ncbi:MAG: response regulator [Anaerolineae bacterium]